MSKKSFHLQVKAFSVCGLHCQEPEIIAIFSSHKFCKSMGIFGSFTRNKKEKLR